ncbi:hypothetical protein [Micromonospora deserti]|uniref:hypothetical protein n=1 Tax=Micromonospora deserti TaxID=2070366 RepID=UPI002D7741C5|nr:hypothetical protein [Micromonospora deserti]
MTLWGILAAGNGLVRSRHRRRCCHRREMTELTGADVERAVAALVAVLGPHTGRD